MNLRNWIFRSTHAKRLSLRIICENILPKPALNMFYRATNPDIPDRNGYVPFFSPARTDAEFLKMFEIVKSRTMVNRESMFNLWTLAKQSCGIDGNFIETGVYKGGTARLLQQIIKDVPGRTLHLFDTFQGMPETDKNADFHKAGDFSDTSLEAVRAWVGMDSTIYHPGFLPATFAGLEDERFAFAHIDVDIKSSVHDCCAFIYPRMSAGGIMIFDDYGYPTCPGARAAVDEFFAGKPERPLAQAYGQAIVFKL